MSPCTKRWRASPCRLARFSRLPAYVSLSRLTTGSSFTRSQSRMKFAPMKPAPPVTNITKIPYERLQTPDIKPGRLDCCLVVGRLHIGEDAPRAQFGRQVGQRHGHILLVRHRRNDGIGI